MNLLTKVGIGAVVTLGTGVGVYACTRAPEISPNNTDLLRLEGSDLRASQIGDQIRQVAFQSYPYDAFKLSSVDRYAELEKKRYYCATESAYDLIKMKTAKCAEPTESDPTANLACIAISLNAKLKNVIACSEAYIKQEEALLCRICSGPVCGASHNCGGFNNPYQPVYK
jgi:hypothetical protein